MLLHTKCLMQHLAYSICLKNSSCCYFSLHCLLSSHVHIHQSHWLLKLIYLITPGTFLYFSHPDLSMEFRASTALSEVLCVSRVFLVHGQLCVTPSFDLLTSHPPCSLGVRSIDVTSVPYVSSGLCLNLDTRFLDYYMVKMSFTLHQSQS